MKLAKEYVDAAMADWPEDTPQFGLLRQGIQDKIQKAVEAVLADATKTSASTEGLVDSLVESVERAEAEFAGASEWKERDESRRDLDQHLAKLEADLEVARREVVFFAERLEKQDHQYSQAHPQAAMYRAKREALEARAAAAERAREELESELRERLPHWIKWIEAESVHLKDAEPYDAALDSAKRMMAALSRAAAAERERDAERDERGQRQLFANDKLHMVALRWHRARYAFRGVPDPGEAARVELLAAEAELDLWANPSRSLIDTARRTTTAVSKPATTILEIVERMESEYALNKHAVEWAKWIREEYLEVPDAQG